MNIKRYNQLKELAVEIGKHSTFGSYLSYSDARDLWDQAVYYNRIQNNFIKDGLGDEVVKQISAKDELTGNLGTFSIRAKKNYSRLDWFKILIANKHFFLTRQQTYKVLEI
jgi:hypothetical protein